MHHALFPRSFSNLKPLSIYFIVFVEFFFLLLFKKAAQRLRVLQFISWRVCQVFIFYFSGLKTNCFCAFSRPKTRFHFGVSILLCNDRPVEVRIEGRNKKNVEQMSAWVDEGVASVAAENVHLNEMLLFSFRRKLKRIIL